MPNQALPRQRSWRSGGASATPIGAVFDGSNDYLSRGGGLTGAADGKLVTLSFWIKLAGDAATDPILYGASGRWVTSKDQTTDNILVEARDSGGNVRLSVNSASNTLKAANGWQHVLASFDMANSSKRHLYIDDTSSLSVSTYTNTDLDFTLSDWFVGIPATPALKLAATLADLWFAPGVYIDFSVEANRRKFITAAGGPASLGSDGSAPTGTPPLLFLGGPEISTWHTNKGTGGGMTVTGALTSAAGPT